MRGMLFSMLGVITMLMIDSRLLHRLSRFVDQVEPGPLPYA